MDKTSRTTKKKQTKGRKRKNKDLESQEEEKTRQPKSSKKEYNFKKLSADAHEDSKLIRDYLPEEAVKHYEIISKLINEFNWNSKDMNIYRRNMEKEEIVDYIEDNMKNSKSGLMYVCGHPGTGKSSTMRVILKNFDKQMANDENLKKTLHIFNYNGMIFKNLYDFSVQFIKDFRMDFLNKKSKNIESQLKSTDDVIDLGNRIQKLLYKYKEFHKLIIIDEVDNLSMTESARNFVSFLNSILKSDTNTTIIGIANSVDLLSKVSQNSGKEGELVEKKWVFSPYSKKDVTKIIEAKIKKFNEKYSIKSDYLEPGALTFAASKVARVSGDIRVAFDLIKTALTHITLKYRQEANEQKEKDDTWGSSESTILEENKNEKSNLMPFNKEAKEEPKPPVFELKVDFLNPKVGMDLINTLWTTKFGSNGIEAIKTLPSSLIVSLKTLEYVFDERNSINKNFKVSELFTANSKTLDKLCLPHTNMSDFWSGLKILDTYSLISYTEGKNIKAGKVSLKVDIDELKYALKETDVLKS